MGRIERRQCFSLSRACCSRRIDGRCEHVASWAVSCILNTTYMYVYTQDIYIYILDFCGKKSLIFLGIYVAPSLNVVVQKSIVQMKWRHVKPIFKEEFARVILRAKKKQRFNLCPWLEVFVLFC